MPVKQEFEKREDAPEWLRSSLLEQDGKFVFEAETIVEVAGLKKALDAERKAKEEAAKAAKHFDGIDPEEYKRLKEEAEKASTEKLRSKGDWETREKQLKEQLASELAKREQHFTGELATREERVARLQQALDKALIEAEATSAIAAKKGVPQLLLPHILRQVRVVEEGESFVARVIGADGNPRIADVKGTPFTIANLVNEMFDDPVFGRAFEASGAAGSGAASNTAGRGNTKTIQRAVFEGMSQADRMKVSKDGIQVVD